MDGATNRWWKGQGQTIGVPWISVIAFGLAAAFGLMAGATTAFHNLTIWGGSPWSSLC